MQTPSILSVTQLNAQVKLFIEQMGMVYVKGEISNLSKPSSGHYYFTLKDQKAQIRCVFFKNHHANSLGGALKLTEGLEVVAGGQLSLYEARGDYQLILTQVAQSGQGILYQQFEALKKKLLAQGLFDAARKKTIPRFPNNIGVITSNTGAAIQDILSTLARRYPPAKVWIYPCDVQGDHAAKQLVHAINRANANPLCDVLIVARGGGSIEDLWAFNDEALALAIANSKLPIVSGVGHETDVTIADFVADYRAETPTAAASAVTPNRIELSQFIEHQAMALQMSVQKQMQYRKLRLMHLLDKLSFPTEKIKIHKQKNDYAKKRLMVALTLLLHQKKHRLSLSTLRLNACNPSTIIQQQATELNQSHKKLQHHMLARLHEAKLKLSNLLHTLNTVSPLATLDRGYAIASHRNKVIFSSKDLSLGDIIEIRLSRGMVTSQVISSHE